MKPKHRWSIWIFVLLLVTLSVLSVLAPRKWTSVADSHSYLLGNELLEPSPSFLTAPSIAEGNRPDCGPSVAMLSQAAVQVNRTSHNLTPLVGDRSDNPADADIQGQLLPPTQLPAAEIRLIATDDVPRNMSPLPIRRVPSNIQIDYSLPDRVVEIRPLVMQQETVQAAVNGFDLSAVGDFATTAIGDLATKANRDCVVTELSDQGGSFLSASSTIRLVARQTVPVQQTSVVDVEKQLADLLPDASKHWPIAEHLIKHLDGLASHGVCADWCREVQDNLQSLGKIDTIDSPVAQASLNSLNVLLARGFSMIDTIEDPAVQSHLARAAFALKRRLEIWNQIVVIAASPSEISAAVPTTDATYLGQILDDLESKLADYGQGQLWHDYLLLDEARHRYTTDVAADTVECRRLAKRILLRLDYSILTPEHREFLAQRQFVDYSNALKHLAAEPVDYFRLLEEVELYEGRRTPQHALHVAAAQQILRWSLDKQVARLGQQLDTNYRNANVRITLSREILNRFVPQQEPVTESVDDVILGAHTWGCSQSKAELRVKLLPSSDTWRIGLQAEGQVISETISAKGPAKFYSLGDATFLAEKQIVVHSHGYYHLSADAAAETSSGLAGMETDMDPVPIIGDIVQAIAKQRYQSQAPAARSEMQHMVATQARSRLDTEVAEQLGRARQQIFEHMYRPLERLALNPVVLQMSTTEDQLVARYRLAGHHQLASHTPRPIPPQDSVFSLQVHESALNNLTEQLGWEGREANLRDLYLEIGELFAISDLEIPAEFPDDVIIRFAGKNAIRFTFDEGRIGFQMSIYELKQGRNRWTSFAVRVYYRPAPERPDADMVRDQYVELFGPRLKFRDQIALRGVFSRVFQKDQPIALVSQRLTADPRLDGYRVSQLTVGEGWMGLAIGNASQGDNTPLLTCRER